MMRNIECVKKLLRLMLHIFEHRNKQSSNPSHHPQKDFNHVNSIVGANHPSYKQSKYAYKKDNKAAYGHNVTLLYKWSI